MTPRVALKFTPDITCPQSSSASLGVETTIVISGIYRRRRWLLDGTRLDNASLRCAFLTGAVLLGADLTYADLTDTELDGTDVTGIGTALETN